MKAFVIYCSTGCSCCNEENHYRGPYQTYEKAETAVEFFKETKLISSQFAPEGRYDIEEREAELLPDGRVIIGTRVTTGFDDCYGDRFSDL